MICAAKSSRVAITAAAVFLALGTTPASAMNLSDALQLALQHDPAATVADAQYAVDRESSVIDRASRLPLVVAGGNYQYANTDSVGVFGASKDKYPTWAAQVEARQPLFRLDWFARGDRARALDSQADAAYQQRRQQLLERVAERYFGVLDAQDQLAQAEAEAQAVRESLEDTRKRYSVELVPGTDLKEAQARDDLAHAHLLSARTALETAQDALDEITGSGYVTLPRLPEDIVFPALTPAELEPWVKAARAHNPSVRLAQEAAVVAAADRKSRLSDALPTLDLVATASRQDTSEYTFGQKVDDARVGVELNMPIYAGGATRALLRQADANVRVADAELNRVVLETERTTRQMYRKVHTAYAESEAYRRSLESALSAQAATQAGYDAGTRTITDVLDAKSNVTQARREMNASRYNLLLSLVQLKSITGELSDQDFAQIDQLLR